MPTAVSAWLRVALSVILLALLLRWLEVDALIAAAGDLAPAWIALALAISVPQVLVSAWRWRLTAALLGVPLPFAQAVREYYLATFLNQILPGGVLGDALRAHRHASALAGATPAWHAVLIERASGQLALTMMAGLATAASPGLRGLVANASDGVALGGWIGVGLVAVAVATVAGRRLRALARDTRSALLSRRALPLQMGASVLVVASYVLVYLCCARAIGLDTPSTLLWPLMTWTLLAMALPVSVGGWGVREGAAALAWMSAGLPAAQGVAGAIAYGLVVLLSSLPGAVVLLMSRRRMRSR